MKKKALPHLPLAGISPYLGSVELYRPLKKKRVGERNVPIETYLFTNTHVRDLRLTDLTLGRRWWVVDHENPCNTRQKVKTIQWTFYLYRHGWSPPVTLLMSFTLYFRCTYHGPCIIYELFKTDNRNIDNTIDRIISTRVRWRLHDTLVSFKNSERVGQSGRHFITVSRKSRDVRLRLVLQETLQIFLCTAYRSHDCSFNTG